MAKTVFLINRVRAPCQKEGRFAAKMTILHATHQKQGVCSSTPKTTNYENGRVSLRQRHGLPKAGFSFPWKLVLTVNWFCITSDEEKGVLVEIQVYDC